MSSPLRRLPLYLHTVRRLRPSQILARLSLLARQHTLHRWPRLLAWRYGVAEGQVSLASRPLLPYDRRLLQEVVRAAWLPEELAGRLADLKAGRFHFLNRTVAFSGRIDWQAPGESRLWRYNLHYFDYCWDLILAEAGGEDQESYLCFRFLTEDWLSQNPTAQGVGWHAYPLALRVVNWIYAALAFQRWLAQDDSFRGRFLASLYSQCRFLADHLEWDCRGNHLLEDGKTLLTAGLFFSGPEAEGWFCRGARLVWQALEEQILADGGHYERSPMYHAIVLQDYLEIYALYRARGLALPAGAISKLQAMVDFFVGLRHPDGEIPLFGDAAFGIAPGLEDLLPLAAVALADSRYRWPGHAFGPFAVFLLGESGRRAFAELEPGPEATFGESRFFPASGYFILGDHQGNALILDGGEFGPDEVPAHGHCNTFGYELSVAGQRVVVDSGVETYEPGRWRDYYRSTRAHNTLMVGGIELSETWMAFRVGRRARLRQVQGAIHPEVAYFEGTHDGFSRQVPGLLHRRLVVHVPQAFWLISDYLWGAAGEHRLESFVHLHPEITAGLSNNRPEEEPLPLGKLDCNLLAYLVPYGIWEVSQSRGENRPIQGWYAPRFGCHLPNQVIVMRWRGTLPHLCGYVLMLPEEEARAARLHIARTGTADVYTLIRPSRQYQITRTNGGVVLNQTILSS